MIQVKIYSTQTCPFCEMEKEYLEAKGIKYDNIFIDKDKKAAKELMDLEGQYGVPFTVFTKEDGSKETLLGYNREEINRILNIS